MLAAAGSPAVHPHAEGDSAARARWDNDMEHFNGDLLALQDFGDAKAAERNAAGGEYLSTWSQGLLDRLR